MTLPILTGIACLSALVGIFTFAQRLDQKARANDLAREREKLAAWLHARRTFTMRAVISEALHMNYNDMSKDERTRIATRLRTEFGCWKLSKREHGTPYVWAAPQPPIVIPTGVQK